MTTTYIAVVKQPAIANVLCVDTSSRSVFRLKQHALEYCVAYGHGYADSKQLSYVEDECGLGNACELYARQLGWIAA